MDEPPDPQKPKTPRASGLPGAPLPRLWKYPAEDASELEGESTEFKKKKKPKGGTAGSESPPVKKARKKDEASSKPSKKPKLKEGVAETKGVLIEETPELDTYEARQRVRIAVGAVLFSMIALTGFFVYKAFAPAPDLTENGLSAEMPTTTGGSGNAGEKAEQEARILFQRAGEMARNGNPKLAIAQLKKITTSYSSTQIAKEAKQALDRPAQNLPLFLDSLTVLASPPDPKAPSIVAKKADVKVVDATNPAIPKGSGGETGLILPANPAETARTSQSSPANSGVASKLLPAGFKPRQGSGVHPSGWPIEIVGDRDGAPLVLVYGDTFTQGRDEGDASEGPAHQVILGTYYIDVHEVTVRQFELFQKESGKRTERTRAIAKDPILANASEDEDLPVTMVTARDASDFAAWAGKRLPTEAQWESAARTPDGRIHPWGPEPATWAKPRVSRQIDPIRSYALDMSPYGVFDLAGNAWEWTKDWFDPKYYQSFKTSTASNPTGPTVRPKAAQLVVKGSSKEWMVSKREGLGFDKRLPYVGFRCVLQVEGPGNAFEPASIVGPPASKAAGGQQGGSDVPF